MSQEELQAVVTQNIELKAKVYDLSESLSRTNNDLQVLATHVMKRLSIEASNLQEVLDGLSEKFPLPEELTDSSDEDEEDIPL